MAAAAAVVALATRTPGPAGSLLIVEPHDAVPVVHIIVAARTGAARDPRGREGLTHFAAELARRGAAGKTRAEMDSALDALGASLDAQADADSVRFEGQVLARNLDPFLALLADVILRPDFTPDELERTRRELMAGLDEMRNDDRALCGRYFRRRVYGDHPYGRTPIGTQRSLARLERDEMVTQFRSTFVGKNLVFAAAGAVTTEAITAKLASAFAELKAGPVPRAPALPPPAPPEGWTIQLVDKPDRQQTQIMLGHPTLPAAHPDFIPLAVAVATFGGHGMKATMMEEVRTKRGLAYGAYMSVSGARGPGVVQGWVFPAAEKTVTTLKLVLKLYKDFATKGISPARLAFFQGFLAGSFASEMDSPSRRLESRVSAEIEGLPPDFVDTYVERVKAVTPRQAAEAIKKHLDPHNLAITMVATADVMKKLLIESKVKPGAIDVVKFDSY